MYTSDVAPPPPALKDYRKEMFALINMRQEMVLLGRATHFQGKHHTANITITRLTMDCSVCW